MWKQCQEDRGLSYGLQSKTTAILGYIRLSFKEREREKAFRQREEINNSTCILDEKIVLGKNHQREKRFCLER